MKNVNQKEDIEICIHIITLNYLRHNGISQHFYSPHGPEYDDKYSYLHGMNLLTFEGYSRAHLINSIDRIKTIFQTKHVGNMVEKKPYYRLRSRKNKMKSLEMKVPVDRPRIGILIPQKTLIRKWVKELRGKFKNLTISDDIRNLLPDIEPESFVDYSLSRSYQYTLENYIPLLESIRKNI
ncbi:MAG: hypothetical protein ACXAC8_09225 [Candidatus Hodarchaeales archaeon]